MARLFDDMRVALQGIYPSDTLNECVVIDITNVADYLATFDGPVKARDVPFCVPPFETFFAEYVITERIKNWFNATGLIDTTTVFDSLGIKRIGCMVNAIDLLHANPSIVDEIQKHFRDTKAPPAWQQTFDNARWLARGAGYSYSSSSGRELVYTLGEFDIAIDLNGTVSQNILAAPPNRYVPKEITGMWLDSMVYPLEMSWSFMNCKNVKRVENKPSPKVNMRRAKDGKPPLTKYYTLGIEPLAQILKTEGQTAKNGLVKAMHICRGHFATYDEKPLFGRIKGTFWIPQHVRGAKDAGEVKKDYRIKPLDE